ncbi:MAG: hypothetical protein P8Y69_15565 [Gammaproteobacteria bacterium]
MKRRLELPSHIITDPDIARLASPLDAGGDIHAIAQEVTLLGSRHISHVDTYPERLVSQALGFHRYSERALKRVGRSHRQIG